MLLRFCNLVSVLFKLTLISVNKVSGEDLFPNRFVNRVIMHTWIVNKELLLLFDFRVWSWNRRQQSLGVRMQRMTEKFFCFRQLDDLTFVDNRNSVRNKAYNRQVMRDEQIGQASALLQTVEQVQYLRTDRNVQRRRSARRQR